MVTSMTKRVMTVALAASVILSAQASVISAVASTKPGTPSKPTTVTQQSIQTIKLTIDGKEVAIESIQNGGKTFVNIRSLTKVFGAKLTYNKSTKVIELKKGSQIAQIKANDKSAVVNKKKVSLALAPVVVKSKTFFELDQLVQWFGGELIVDAEGNKEYVTVKLLSEVTNPHFLDDKNVVVSKETEEGFDHYVINLDTRKHTKLKVSVVTDNLVPSNNGKSLAYTDENSFVYTYDVATHTEKLISQDTNEKLELQWAADNLSLFYIDGPKSNAIAKITLDGIITKIVDDKVDYKSDLFVHANQNIFLYSVTKTGTSTSDTSGVKEGEDLPDFDVTIDPTGTEPQLYVFDASATSATAKALTSSLENKTFASLFDNGTVAYLSTNTEDEEAISTLKTIDKNMNATTILIADTELFDLKVLNNKLIAHGYTSDDQQFVYEIDVVRGSAKKLAKLSDDSAQITVGTSNQQIIVTDSNGSLSVWKANKWVKITN